MPDSQHLDCGRANLVDNDVGRIRDNCFPGSFNSAWSAGERHVSKAGNGVENAPAHLGCCSRFVCGNELGCFLKMTDGGLGPAYF